MNQDDTLTFEQLGVDRLFVDEMHEFKNLFTPTNVSTIYRKEPCSVLYRDDRLSSYILQRTDSESFTAHILIVMPGMV